MRWRSQLWTFPFQWRWLQIVSNSFFAGRLLCSGLMLSLGLTAGLLDHSMLHFDTERSCNTMVTLSLSIYKTLPFVIVLLLPVSGLSWFEPFKKSSQPAAYGNRGAGVAQLGEEGSSSMLSQPPLKRGLVFQLTELLAVFALLHEVTSVTFIPGSLIESISCNSFVPQMLALGAVACYSGLFVVLYYLLGIETTS